MTLAKPKPMPLLATSLPTCMAQHRTACQTSSYTVAAVGAAQSQSAEERTPASKALQSWAPMMQYAADAQTHEQLYASQVSPLGQMQLLKDTLASPT
jgi:hypothetical protein